MARRRVLESKKKDTVIVPSKAEACDVVFANKSTEELIIVREEKDWPSASEWEPIGVVVVPGEHGVLKSGDGLINQCGIISIAPMNYTTPEVGGPSEQTMCWGGYGTDITGKSDGLGRYDSVNNGLQNYNKVVVGDKGSNNATGLSSSYYAYIPMQRSIGGAPTQSSSPYAPSPYAGSDMKSGEYNEDYGTTLFDTSSSGNSLSDFRGIVNTKIITDLATSQSDWKTADTIINSDGDGYYPAACCCARFKTTGTKAFHECSTDELNKGTGFWYFPACGELGYIIPRSYDINDTISKLYDAYGVGVQLGTSRDF